MQCKLFVRQCNNGQRTKSLNCSFLNSYVSHQVDLEFSCFGHELYCSADDHSRVSVLQPLKILQQCWWYDKYGNEPWNGIFKIFKCKSKCSYFYSCLNNKIDQSLSYAICFTIEIQLALNEHNFGTHTFHERKISFGVYTNKL